MLLQLENPDKESVVKLLDFARQNDLNLSLVDDNENNTFLPGKPLSNEELEKLIIHGRESGNINMENAHFIIRKHLNGD